MRYRLPLITTYCEVIPSEIVDIKYYGLCGTRATPITVYFVTTRYHWISSLNYYYIINGVKFCNLPKDIKIGRILLTAKRTTYTKGGDKTLIASLSTTTALILFIFAMVYYLLN